MKEITKQFTELSEVVLEPATEQFINSINGSPDVFELPLKQARLNAVNLQGPFSSQQTIEEHIDVPVGPAWHVSVYIVRPARSQRSLPVVMYFHGGGWVLNDKNTHRRLLEDIATGADVAVVFVDYSRSPEATYPVANEQAYAATSWIYRNAASLSLDASRLAVMGDSSGGNMAAAVAIMAKERKGPPISLQILFFPTMNDDFETPSYKQFFKNYFLSRDLMKWFWNQYSPDRELRSEITASPLKASYDELRGLPQTLLITAEADVLRDEGEMYARKLIKAGVSVTCVRYIGTIHAFVFLNVLRHTPAADAAIQQANWFLKKGFRQHSKIE